MSSQYLRFNEDKPTRQLTFGAQQLDFNIDDDYSDVSSLTNYKVDKNKKAVNISYENKHKNKNKNLIKWQLESSRVKSKQSVKKILTPDDLLINEFFTTGDTELPKVYFKVKTTAQISF